MTTTRQRVIPESICGWLGPEGQHYQIPPASLLAINYAGASTSISINGLSYFTSSTSTTTFRSQGGVGIGLHGTLAVQIIRDHFPDTPFEAWHDDPMGLDTSQAFLVEQGWVRIDTTGLMLREDQITEAQKRFLVDHDLAVQDDVLQHIQRLRDHRQQINQGRKGGAP